MQSLVHYSDSDSESDVQESIVCEDQIKEVLTREYEGEVIAQTAVIENVDTLTPDIHIEPINPISTIIPVSPIIQAKFEKWRALQQKGTSFNASLSRTQTFTNPAITSQLITYFSIHESGSAFSPKIWDPKTFPREAFYDALSLYQLKK
jgi:HCNGP-like protein